MLHVCQQVVAGFLWVGRTLEGKGVGLKAETSMLLVGSSAPVRGPGICLLRVQEGRGSPPKTVSR